MVTVSRLFLGIGSTGGNDPVTVENAEEARRADRFTGQRFWRVRGDEKHGLEIVSRGSERKPGTSAPTTGDRIVGKKDQKRTVPDDPDSAPVKSGSR